MKKILFSIASLLFVAAAYCQNGTEIKVVVKNYTNFNLYFAPRYNLGFWDGSNNTTYFGVPNTVVGANAATLDTAYQQEGQFEMLPPQTAQQYSNGGTAVGVPLVANGVNPTFNPTGAVMTGFQNQPNWFLKYMKLSWIRFAVSTSTLANAAYGGGLAYGFSSSGMTVVPSTTNYYIGPNNEIFHYYWPSSVSFTAYGTTIYGQFITIPASGSNPPEIHIVFWQ